MRFDKKEIINRLHTEFSKNQLDMFLINSIRKTAKDPKAKAFREALEAKSLLAQFEAKKPLKKDDVVNLCAGFLCNENLVKCYYEAQADEWKTFMDYMIWRFDLDRNDLSEYFGKDVLYIIPNPNRERYSYRYGEVKLIDELEEWKSFLNIKEGWGYYSSANDFLKTVQVTFSFPNLLKDMLKDFAAKPSDYDLLPQAVPTGSHIILFSAETSIFRDLPLLISYHQQNNLKYSQKDYPMLPSAKKMYKTLKLQEIEPECSVPIRNLILAGLLRIGFSIKKNNASPLLVLNQLLKQDFSRHAPAPFLMPHIKGWGYFQPQDFNGGLTSEYLFAISQCPAEQWIAFANFKSYIRYRIEYISPLRYIGNADRLSIDIDGKNKYIELGKHLKHLGDSYIAGHLYMLAAIGAVELALDKSMGLANSYYDRLVAFRLTKLGAYLFDNNRYYEPPEVEGTKLNFDEHKLLITTNGNTDLADTLLENYAIKISDNRYQLTDAKFLKDCRTTQDLKDKISLFRQVAATALPSYWESYFAKLLENSNALKSENRKVVYSLSVRDKELQRLFVQDMVLKALVDRAERFQVIVDEKNRTAFINRMKELGYLME